MSKIKLCFVVSEDWYFISHRFELAKKFIENNLNVSLISNFSKYQNLIKEAGIKINEINFRRSKINIINDILNTIKINKIISKNNYKIFGTNLDFLIENKILLIPDYIKIDVDGIEHLILKGGQNFLADSKIKSVLIEINENFKEQYDEALKILKDSNFSIISKNKNESFSSEKFSNTFNYIFKKNK